MKKEQSKWLPPRDSISLVLEMLRAKMSKLGSLACVFNEPIWLFTKPKFVSRIFVKHFLCPGCNFYHKRCIPTRGGWKWIFLSIWQQKWTQNENDLKKDATFADWPFHLELFGFHELFARKVTLIVTLTENSWR